MKIICIAVLAVLLCNDSTAMPTTGLCPMVRGRLRVECGWSGISPAKCRSLGCCWDDRVPDFPSCYKSDERVSKKGNVGRLSRIQAVFQPVSLINAGEKSTVRSCNAEPRDRVDCGWTSISRKHCEARGCCYERSKTGPWCFQPDSLLIGPKVRSVLECAWECTRTSWRKIADGYSRCGTNSACWMLVMGQSSGTCMAACKRNEDMESFISNITACLGLGNQDAQNTYQECDTDLPCWIDLHGEEALRCFKRNKVGAKRYEVEIPEEKEEYIYEEEEEEEEDREVPPKYYISYLPPDEESSPRNVPREEGHTPLGSRPQFLEGIRRTSYFVETSNPFPVIDETERISEVLPPEEEEPSHPEEEEQSIEG
ncbi:uncharacterized protein LOC143469179 [Clavelina lepadiformis]|uniref:P-type domain-containing protein n=1 Tax=Clavelina lepadiformis TaxID=159417 RepID=A0ABP0G0G6_CLALP